jgi:hypothetical protein
MTFRRLAPPPSSGSFHDINSSRTLDTSSILTSLFAREDFSAYRHEVQTYAKLTQAPLKFQGQIVRTQFCLTSVT